MNQVMASVFDYIVQEVPMLSTIFIGIIIYLYHYNKNVHSFWEKRGIHGPKPWPFVGNYIQLIFDDRMRQQKEWPRKYGKVYGVYRGSEPILYVADAEILQQICVRDIDVFTNHDLPEFLNRYHKSFIFFQKDEHWKRLRALMSPTFTSGKIKRMFRLLNACTDDLIACFDEKLPSSSPPADDGQKRTARVNAKDIYSLFTMDSISTCCYGLKLDRSMDDATRSTTNRNDFVQLAQSLLEEQIWRLIVAVAGPKPLLRILKFKMFEESRFDKLASMVGKLVEKRRKADRRFEDYLQQLIDAKLDDRMELNEMDLEEHHHAGLSHEWLLSNHDKLVEDVKSKGSSTTRTARQMLSEHEIVTNAMLLLLVGLETTASVLTNCTYLLAFHPDIQEKLCEEMKKIVEYEQDDKTKSYFSYEALTSCQYLDSVISETLRFLTPVFHLDRVASRDYRIEKYNLDIPNGCRVSTAFYGVMNDSDYWPEPDRFDPDRFMPANRDKIVPGSYCPFGIGPRHCVGMRFSLTESKLALAKTIMRFRFEPAPGAKFPPLLSKRVDIVTIEDPTIILIPRM